METIGKVFARAEAAEARVKELECYLARYRRITNEIVEVYHTNGGTQCAVDYILKDQAYDELIELKKQEADNG